MTSPPPVLELRGLVKYFPLRGGILSRHPGGFIRAVDGVSFSIRKGETLGLVGESGCGKSTLARLILRVLEPTAGRILLKGNDVSNLKGEGLRRVRRDVQMIFQDPYASLNPRLSAKTIVSEPLVNYQIGNRAWRERRVRELFSRVGLREEQLHHYPHEFSGGQRQRIGIARALALNPSLIIADEPVSALDVSIQAQILNLLADLKKEFELSYLFISHDLSVVEHVSNTVAIMYLGTIVEIASRDALFQNPYHPYTQALLEAVPTLDPCFKRERRLLTGDVPSPSHLPSGCRFRTRCPVAMPECSAREPPLTAAEDGHLVACHLVGGPGFSSPLTTSNERRKER
jgi:oligopeptide transport system ATP-binding protein